ncbi:hypothetical protein LTR05_004229 [Lithohypha guttulata]|uniref:Probable E3 ubiquitin ligase complex SCF subunit sconB n=1 Tax=Lithohypha guttulata TaxID=1690604 RepID=A0AAN7Y7A4_9EURO|nr:hypothetical protein LTR05_004229 [Lithohypha guttulata]
MDDLHMQQDSRLNSTSSSFKLDEGFAEDSQQHGDQIQNSFVAWLNTQSDEAKADIAYEILRTLRSTDIAAVVERLNPLLHMDPIEKLPPEIISHVFSHLDASTLLTASLASSTWRERILDPRLWQDLYKSEGWGIDAQEVRRFEEAYSDSAHNEFKRGTGERRRPSAQKGQSLFKRRATSDWLKSTPRRVSTDVAGWKEQHGIVEADMDTAHEKEDEIMADVTAQSPQRPNKRSSQDSGDEMYLDHNSSPPVDPLPASNLILLDDSGYGRMDWAYLYKQRQKLENNWLKGRFTNFSLPHPNYSHEAHSECVYTIQFFGKWLVSGSRDKTLRVWDLDTRRLRGKPLVGHSQSVLCLQFDPTPQEDIIVSGSSDSSIIIWKFSTGQKVQTIQHAHDESVLNLRFDRRYLVTCSKDKNIKIWNRHALLPTDPDYPTARTGSGVFVPTHIIDIRRLDINLLEAGMASGVYKSLKPYTHLMTLDGHNAAVNAIQIHGNTIVSASGDRLIRIWDLSTGHCTKAVPGHQKGIACVQYDGRRIVSGSSDNTVRIYDATTSTEVATLLGHTNLVRTVQAGFGDGPGIEAEELAAARAAEQKYEEDVESGRLVEDRLYSRRLRNGDFGTSRLTIGSRLPPGGGGSKWARIVSGSYDESIIIWKKDSLGHWVVGQTLKQDENTQSSIDGDANAHTTAARTSRRTRPRPEDTAERSLLNDPFGLRRPNTAPDQVAVSNTASLGNGNVMTASQIMQAAMNTSLASVQTGVRNITNISTMLGGSSTRPAVQTAVNQITTQMQSTTNSASSTATREAHPNPTSSEPLESSNARSRQATASRTQPPNAQTNTAPQQQQQAHGQSVSRVFKLQFDARRIVCCSQDSRIIGWDFANGDPEIEECAKFFIGP